MLGLRSRAPLTRLFQSEPILSAILWCSWRCQLWFLGSWQSYFVCFIALWRAYWFTNLLLKPFGFGLNWNKNGWFLSAVFIDRRLTRKKKDILKPFFLKRTFLSVISHSLTSLQRKIKRNKNNDKYINKGEKNLVFLFIFILQLIFAILKIFILTNKLCCDNIKTRRLHYGVKTFC